MAPIRRLKSISKNLLIYLLLAMVPSLIISALFAQHHVRVEENQYRIKAQEYANFHTMNIKNFLGETVGRLEMLATSIQIQHSNLINIETVLNETVSKDPRFSGFYLVDVNGDMQISTNPVTKLINFDDRPYFQQAVTTRKTSISDPHTGAVTGRFIITIATPIVENGQVNSLLLASLRIDEIGVAIKDSLRDEEVIVTDQTGHTLFRVGNIVSEKGSVKASMKISPVEWVVSTIITDDSNLLFGKNFLKYLIICLAITNILFLTVKYLLLRGKLKRDKEQTEIHKLELIGNLAASTAHEIRNPLTGIKGLVKLLSEENHDQKAQSYFEVIQLEIDRINGIVSELLVLGKPTAYMLKTYNANDIIKEIEPIILSEANFMNVKLSIDFARDHLPVSCVKDHLKQVILNLTKNSLQAMPNGGEISISLEKQFKNFVIKIVDNGVGMQKEQVSQAFNPFYTLKKDGSGLGLTVCKRIIETYDGSILLESTLQKGSKVTITLPLFNKQKV